MLAVFSIILIVSIPDAIGKFILKNKMWTESLDGFHVKDIADYLARQKMELWLFTLMDRLISPNTSARDLLFLTDVPNEYATTMGCGQESSHVAVRNFKLVIQGIGHLSNRLLFLKQEWRYPSSHWMRKMLPIPKSWRIASTTRASGSVPTLRWPLHWAKDGTSTKWLWLNRSVTDVSLWHNISEIYLL